MGAVRKCACECLGTVSCPHRMKSESSAYLKISSTEVLLVGRSRQGPRAPHPPDRERVAKTLVRHVAAAGPSRVQLVALQNLAQEVDVPRRQLQRLDLAEFVRRESWNDLT